MLLQPDVNVDVEVPFEVIESLEELFAPVVDELLLAAKLFDVVPVELPPSLALQTPFA